MTIGIYGRIGSGKSEVASVFAEYGAAVISADDIGREVVENDPSILKQLVSAFGDGILASDGTLDRRATGKIAFSSPANLQLLDSIVHPALLKELIAEIGSLKEHGRYPCIVVDAALIIRWGIQSEFDVLICVVAPESDVIDRLARNGVYAEDVRQRLEMQIPADLQAAEADHVIKNDGSLEQLRVQAKRLCELILGAENTV